MRLIDAKKLKGCAIVRPHTHEDIKAIESCSELVEHRSIPTAYDVDKVLEQLHRISDEAEDKISVCEEEYCLYHDGFSDGVDEAIEIVKGGVVYEKL